MKYLRTFTVALLDEGRVGVVPLVGLLARLQYVVQSVERHLHRLSVRQRQQVAQRRDAALLH